MQGLNPLIVRKVRRLEELREDLIGLPHVIDLFNKVIWMMPVIMNWPTSLNWLGQVHTKSFKSTFKGNLYLADYSQLDNLPLHSNFVFYSPQVAPASDHICIISYHSIFCLNFLFIKNWKHSFQGFDVLFLRWLENLSNPPPFLQAWWVVFRCKSMVGPHFWTDCLKVVFRCGGYGLSSYKLVIFGQINKLQRRSQMQPLKHQEPHFVQNEFKTAWCKYAIVS